MDLLSFEMGVLYSAAIIVATHDEPTIAADLLNEAGLSEADCSSLDDYEKKYLRILVEQNGLKLSGL